MDLLANNLDNMLEGLGNVDFGGVVKELPDAVKKVLNGLTIDGKEDVAKLLDKKNKINDFIKILEGLLRD